MCFSFRFFSKNLWLGLDKIGYNSMTTRPYDVPAYNAGYMGYQGYQGGYMSAGGYGTTMGAVGADYMTTTACSTPYQLSPSRTQPPATPLPDRYKLIFPGN